MIVDLKVSRSVLLLVVSLGLGLFLLAACAPVNVCAASMLCPLMCVYAPYFYVQCVCHLTCAKTPLSLFGVGYHGLYGQGMESLARDLRKLFSVASGVAERGGTEDNVTKGRKQVGGGGVWFEVMMIMMMTTMMMTATHFCSAYVRGVIVPSAL
jgi:hypothetical protein